MRRPLRRRIDSSGVSSVITTAWGVGFGLVLLAQQIGWDETKKLLHRRRKKDEAKDAALAVDDVGAHPARE